MPHLETCLLIAVADRVFCHLVVFLTSFFHWMYKMKYSHYLDSSLIHCLVGLGLRNEPLVKDIGSDGIVSVFHLA